MTATVNCFLFVVCRFAGGTKGLDLTITYAAVSLAGSPFRCEEPLTPCQLQPMGELLQLCAKAMPGACEAR